ncbi:DUF4166 domain-containing protein [Pontixanthobacter aquaemixtae]|uniref:DUF4166 domain-containing protein n=1 Tax=Pontixanthobacter aquaemixtae TaxID=1958940 RepID=UPI001F41B50C|nr:DUF4166 domain-containing protein [Pontixanthobacter aquaemixtae]
MAREDAVSSAPYDTRFRRLIGSENWERLPNAVQRRFSKRLGANSVVCYRGVIEKTRHSRLGRALAQFCRLVGGPLPLYPDTAVPAVVIVSEDMASGGQCWTRIYARKHGFPQVIHSAKRFAGPTGLEEYLGKDLGMALRVYAEPDGLVFRSDHYFLLIGRMRIKLPHWIGPGNTTVRHRDLGGGRFAFELDVDHPLFGKLVHQRAIFSDD